MSVTTPNMSLVQPGVNTEPGPDWAVQLNNSLDLLDVHDHSSGKGVKITPAGLNINAELPFNDNKINSLKSLGLNSFSGEGISNVYQFSGDLYWRNSDGIDVRITNGTNINVGSLGTIGGDYSTDPNDPLINFSTATGDYDFFKKTAGETLLAGVNMGELTLFEEVENSNGITIKSPTSLAAAYNITLPPLQAGANQSLISVDVSGNWTYTREPTSDRFGINNGTETEPSIYGNSDNTTGLFFPQVGKISSISDINTGDRNVFGFKNRGDAITSISLENNTADDNILFKNDNGSLIHELAKATGQYKIKFAGTERLRIEENGSLRLSNGTSATGALSFLNEEGLGIYRAASGVLAVAVGGVGRYAFTSTAFRPSLTNTYDLGSDNLRFDNGFFDRLLVASGSVTTPCIAAADDLNDNAGIFFPGENQIAMTANNTQCVRFTAQETVPGQAGVQNLGTTVTRWNAVNAVSGSFTGALSSSTLSVTSNITTPGSITCNTISANNIFSSSTSFSTTTGVVSSGFCLYYRVAGRVTMHGRLTITGNGVGKINLPIPTVLSGTNSVFGFGIGSTGVRIECTPDVINTLITVVASGFTAVDSVYFTIQYDL